MLLPQSESVYVRIMDDYVEKVKSRVTKGSVLAADLRSISSWQELCFVSVMKF